ncbi:hypothetical protein JYU34_013640 [Plutella xylostella]|uniref:Uncharacterized protein n=1 Tax=Plutella xylostella TaxID=51655 RepID=A0ABQ7QAK5_PLUXY|nr:hypothetical protein JYU34_013640 [Plutella xylostella]
MYKLVNFKPVSHPSSKCFCACVFREYGWLMGNDQYNFLALNEMVINKLSNQPLVMDQILNVIESCKYVDRMQLVPSPKVVCERAALGYNCASEKWNNRNNSTLTVIAITTKKEEKGIIIDTTAPTGNAEIFAANEEEIDNIIVQQQSHELMQY